jgi:hypothetical protein
MSSDDEKIPPEIGQQLLSFVREVDGDFEIVDMKGLVNFIQEHGKQYPTLLKLININEQAIVEHYQKTGEVPPGIKLVRKTREDDKVTKLEVFRGPTSAKPKS